jgi:hypothetical protein
MRFTARSAANSGVDGEGSFKTRPNPLIVAQDDIRCALRTRRGSLDRPQGVNLGLILDSVNDNQYRRNGAWIIPR